MHQELTIDSVLNAQQVCHARQTTPAYIDNNDVLCREIACLLVCDNMGSFFDAAVKW